MPKKVKKRDTNKHDDLLRFPLGHFLSPEAIPENSTGNKIRSSFPDLKTMTDSKLETAFNEVISTYQSIKMSDDLEISKIVSFCSMDPDELIEKVKEEVHHFLSPEAIPENSTSFPDVKTMTNLELETVFNEVISTYQSIKMSDDPEISKIVSFCSMDPDQSIEKDKEEVLRLDKETQTEFTIMKTSKHTSCWKTLVRKEKVFERPVAPVQFDELASSSTTDVSHDSKTDKPSTCLAGHKRKGPPL